MIQTNPQRFLADTQGNLSIVAAIAGTLLLTAVGASMDGGRLISTKMQLQSITDAAALMGAKPENISDEARSTLALRSVDAHVERRAGLTLHDRNVQVTDDGSTVKVRLTAEVPLLFGAFLGGSTRHVSVSSVAQENTSSHLSAVSISVVLDLSTSMQDRFDTGSRIAAVKAAVSETFNMIQSRYGSEAAAQAQISTGLYPFNWGMVDGEVVALQPGTNTVVEAMNFMPLSEGSVPPSAIEAALADQITSGTGDRYIVYVTDGRVDDERGDVPGQFIGSHGGLAGAASAQCEGAKDSLEASSQQVKSDYMNANYRFSNWGPGYTARFLTAIENDPNHLMTTVDHYIDDNTGNGRHNGTKLRKVIESRNDNILMEAEYLSLCTASQTARVLNTCDEARDDGVSIIAINMAEENKSASLITDYCALGHFDLEDDGDTDAQGAGRPGPFSDEANGDNTDFEMKVSIDGKSRSARVSELGHLREVLSTLLPEASQSERTVRLVN